MTNVKTYIDGRKDGGTMKIYGYCRISTQKQSIDRQIRNIKDAYPDAIIITEVFTGTQTNGRHEFCKLLKHVRSGDVIVFDSVSRMSRNADEGFTLYQQLYQDGVKLVFLKEPYINTDVLHGAQDRQLARITGTGDPATDKLLSAIIDALNDYTMDLANAQIKLAFDQAEKECTDLRQRTKEGIETARINGSQIGHPQGTSWETKKAKACKEKILKYSKTFGGTMADVDVQRLCDCSRNTYFQYKRELRAERDAQTDDE